MSCRLPETASTLGIGDSRYSNALAELCPLQHPAPRFVSAVARNLAELQRAILNRSAMVAIEMERAFAYAIFRVAYLALFNDYIAHAMKVFENRPRVASFWYLYRTDQFIADQFMRTASIDVEALGLISERLKLVRDATHFHIDADTVLDPRSIWRQAGIDGRELSKCIDDVWKVVQNFQVHYGLPPVKLLNEIQKNNLRDQVRRVKL